MARYYFEKQSGLRLSTIRENTVYPVESRTTDDDYDRSSIDLADENPTPSATPVFVVPRVESLHLVLL